MRDVEKHALQFIQHAGEPCVAILQRGLAVQPIFIQQVLGAALLSGNVHLLLSRVKRRGVRKFNEHPLGAAQVVAHGNDQDSFANLVRAGDIIASVIPLCDSPCQECHHQQRRHRG